MDRMVLRYRTKAEAIAYCTERYEEQCLAYPKTRAIPKHLYIARNAIGAMQYFIPNPDYID